MLRRPHAIIVLDASVRRGTTRKLAEALAGWDPDLQRMLRAAGTTLRLPLFDRPPALALRTLSLESFRWLYGYDVASASMGTPANP